MRSSASIIRDRRRRNIIAANGRDSAPRSVKLCVSLVPPSSPASSYRSSSVSRYGMPQDQARSEEHTSELQSLMRRSYAVFCLTQQKNQEKTAHDNTPTNTQQ